MIGRQEEELVGLACARKACEAKELEPARMVSTGQSLSGCFVHPVWPLTALERRVIEEEAQSIQVTWT